MKGISNQLETFLKKRIELSKKGDFDAYKKVTSQQISFLNEVREQISKISIKKFPKKDQFLTIIGDYQRNLFDRFTKEEILELLGDERSQYIDPLKHIKSHIKTSQWKKTTIFTAIFASAFVQDISIDQLKKVSTEPIIEEVKQEKVEKKETPKKTEKIIEPLQKKSFVYANRGVKPGNFYVLRNAPCTAILIESAFVSNKDEIEFFNEHIREYSRVVADGILEYLMKKEGAKIAILDAGHGGKDPGAVENGFREKDLALKQTLLIGKILSAKGVKVYYTRTEDKFIPLSGRTDFAKKVMTDNGNANYIFASMHLNAAGTENAKGHEQFYYKKGNKESKFGKIAATYTNKNFERLRNLEG